MGLFKMLRGKASHHHNHLKSKAEERSLVVDETTPSDEASGWVMPSHDKQHARLTPSAAGECGSIEELVALVEKGTDKMALICESVIGNDCTVCVAATLTSPVPQPSYIHPQHPSRCTRSR